MTVRATSSRPDICQAASHELADAAFAFACNSRNVVPGVGLSVDFLAPATSGTS